MNITSQRAHFFWALLRARSAAILLGASLAITCSVSPALASLVVDLRFSSLATDKAMDISGLAVGSTITIQVWAVVTGTDTDLANDGLLNTFFGLISTTTTSNLTGGITSGMRLGPFDAPPSVGFDGTFGDRNADGRSDWRGTSAGPGLPTDWPKASASFGVTIASGGSTGQVSATDPTHAWEFHVADAVFTIGSKSLPESGTINALAYSMQYPMVIPPSRARWREDGVTKTGTGISPTTVESAVIFTLTSASGGSPPSPDIDANPGPLVFNGLLNAPSVSGSQFASILNNGTGAATYTTSTTGVATVSINASGTLAPGALANLFVSLSSSGSYTSYGSVPGSVVLNTSGDPDPAGSDKINIMVNVGEATTNGTAFGPSFGARVEEGMSYAGLASRTHAGVESGAVVIGTEARILGGHNGDDFFPESIVMRWRARTAFERSDGGVPTAPPLPNTAPGRLPSTLISDVVELLGLLNRDSADLSDTHPYVLQMTYDPARIGGPAAEHAKALARDIYLVWLNPHGDGTGDDQWENAVLGNFHPTAVAVSGFLGSWTAAGSPLTVGSWGVDEEANTVWAVLDHASEFAVIPEPASFTLLGVGGAVLLGMIMRRKGAWCEPTAARDDSPTKMVGLRKPRESFA